MVTPTHPRGIDHHAPSEAPDDALAALTTELRALYAETYRLTLTAAEREPHRWETPDGPADPVYIADNAACRTVNRHLPTVVARWLPGARLHSRITEPAVIEATWLHQQRLVAIDLDYTCDFGDPNALTVREVTR
ncbi:MAG: hypothetical protein AAGA65_29885 [Actinomycetota bacterium]